MVGQEWNDDVRIILFITLKAKSHLNDKLVADIKENIKNSTSIRHVPAKIIQVTDIPRTRSGKIAELTVRDIINGKKVKNMEALARASIFLTFLPFIISLTVNSAILPLRVLGISVT